MSQSDVSHSIPWFQASQRPLPGVQPLDLSDWIVVGDDFHDQMQLRDRLLTKRPGDVHALDKTGLLPAQELLDTVLGHLWAFDTYTISAKSVTRPDGVLVGIDHRQPLVTLGRLCQEDFCILTKSGPQHVLVGAVLCFPASWQLREKIMRPLTDIHRPVPSYTADIAKRVQRLFDGVQPDRPLWRANALWYDDPSLFQPRSETAPRHRPGSAPYLRSERQCILRLPETRAVVFSIRTAVVHMGAQG
ncbi:heme-dependent oxidative N-demethylase family protein [Pseudaestuariivita rosea]|uniref:heme-dependent oxidative N-demethylase family protein n=1 Tax=Pseudaestuariivita rosea TaxID=2763263 RepID=UPI001ABA29EB|nr:DUF3445 domain-containing protein [Pseudaestuariivita rosea]